MPFVLSGGGQHLPEESPSITEASLQTQGVGTTPSGWQDRSHVDAGWEITEDPDNPTRRAIHVPSAGGYQTSRTLDWANAGEQGDVDLVARVRSASSSPNWGPGIFVRGVGADEAEERILTLQLHGKSIQPALAIGSNHPDRNWMAHYEVNHDWAANQWVWLRMQVLTNADGSRNVKAKFWIDGSRQPTAWTAEIILSAFRTVPDVGAVGAYFRGQGEYWWSDFAVSPIE